MSSSRGFQDMTSTDQARFHSNTGMWEHSMKKFQIFRINEPFHISVLFEKIYNKTLRSVLKQPLKITKFVALVILII